MWSKFHDRKWDFVLAKAGYVHCDIKKENVIVVGGSEVRIAKLSDTGIAVKEDIRIGEYRGEGMYCQTEKYRPPEYFKEDAPLTSMGDIWAYSLLIIELLSWKDSFFKTIPPSSIQSLDHFFNFIKVNIEVKSLSDIFNIPKDLCKELHPEISQMLCYDSSNRTRNLGNFLSHQSFIDDGFLYKSISGKLRDEKWIKLEIPLDHYKILTSWAVEIVKEHEINLPTLSLALTLINALMGKTEKKLMQCKLCAIMALSTAIYDDPMSIDFLSELSDDTYTSDEIRKMIADIILETDGIISYVTPYDIARDYDSMALALETLFNNENSFTHKKNKYEFSNVTELCKITDEITRDLKKDFKNSEQVYEYIIGFVEL